jgi:hypothetical protein
MQITCLTLLVIVVKSIDSSINNLSFALVTIIQKENFVMTMLDFGLLALSYKSIHNIITAYI